MANEATVQFVGRLGSEPELRFTPSGAAVCSFSVAVQSRKKNGDQWEDGETTWFRCNVWRDFAENVAESLHKGDRVAVTGRFEARKYQGNDGSEQLSLDVQVDTIGPDLRFSQAQVRRMERQQGGQQSQGGGYPQGGGQQRQQPQQEAWFDTPPSGGWNQSGGNQRQQGGQYQQPRQQQAPQDPWGQPPAGWNPSGSAGSAGGAFPDDPPF